MDVREFRNSWYTSGIELIIPPPLALNYVPPAHNALTRAPLGYDVYGLGPLAVMVLVMTVVLIL
eukprot:11176330-Lingulodinium_polyedra.AAC.1